MSAWGRTGDVRYDDQQGSNFGQKQSYTGVLQLLIQTRILKMVRYFAGMICSLLLVGNCLAETQLPSASLKEFLQAFDNDKTTQYIAVFRDLNDDGSPEAIVHLVSNGWCGSGGCTTLILTQDGKAWRIVKKITVSRPPIRVLSNVSNGWHDIGVWTQGGGVLHGYESVISFDGKIYGKQPHSSALQVEAKKPGDDVITSTRDALPLW